MTVAARPFPPPDLPPPDLFYPDSDGKPMADNTTQFRILTTIKGGADVLFLDRHDVFVAGDLLWYPLEGEPGICAAPDVMVAFGRPKGERRSYRQWREDGVAPQVVFEIMSPGNTLAEMIDKFRFYERYGVDEYYLYDPDRGELAGWQRSREPGREWELVPISEMQGWVSPRLGVRFELGPPRSRDAPRGTPWRELRLYGPDGQLFATYEELAGQRDHERAARTRAETDRARAETDLVRADAARDAERAHRERAEAERDAERLAKERLVARLRELGVELEE